MEWYEIIGLIVVWAAGVYGLGVRFMSLGEIIIHDSWREIDN